MKTDLYIPRTYRKHYPDERFVHFNVVEKESDLFILAKKELRTQAHYILSELRAQIESYIDMDREFLTSLKPIKIIKPAAEIVREMAMVSEKIGVGPMAAVAGAISERVCRSLAQFSDEVIVENGGDIFIINKQPITIAIYAGNSPLSMRLGIEIEANFEGIGVATSSGTIGHSISFGNADAVTVISRNGGFADAAATAICNMVKTKDDIKIALDFAVRIPDILGVVVIMDDKIGAAGEFLKLKTISDL